MLALGFKLPHTEIHLPYHYYKLYDNQTKMGMWRLTKKELKFPSSSPNPAYHCCADGYKEFRFMNEEGAKKSVKNVHIGDINAAVSEHMHDEIMMGYCGAVTFTDHLLGISCKCLYI